MKKNFVLVFIGLNLLLPAPSLADVTDFNIKGGKDKFYSSEPVNSKYFGRGLSGGINEAMALRYAGEEAMACGQVDVALKKMKKACQIEPGNSENHVMLARILNQKIYSSKPAEIEPLIQEALHEWRLVRWHDDEPDQQMEAGKEIVKLKKILDSIEEFKQRRCFSQPK